MIYVLTDRGWIDYDDIFTPNTGNIKKNAVATPIETNDELTEELRKELPMVIVRRGYYRIHTV
jgi:hypothetical protein